MRNLTHLNNIICAYSLVIIIYNESQKFEHICVKLFNM